VSGFHFMSLLHQKEIFGEKQLTIKAAKCYIYFFMLTHILIISTKNESGKLDPEMHQVKKGNEWYFGMKIHIG
jgi:transposase, IS5 family